MTAEQVTNPVPQEVAAAAAETAPVVEAKVVKDIPDDKILTDSSEDKVEKKADEKNANEEENPQDKDVKNISEDKVEEKADKKNANEEENPQDKDVKNTSEGKVEEKADEKKDQLPKSARGVKFDASLLPESNDPAEIRKQVMFYFSDSNLPYDKFLFRMVGKENRSIPIKMVASFKRMRRFKDHSNIVAALKDCDFFEVGGDESDETIKRKEPLILDASVQKSPASNSTAGDKNNGVRKVNDRSLSRSMYAKGFGEETPTTQIDVEKFFEPYGPVNAVRLRRDEKNIFKGSIFVEFKDEEVLAKFISVDPKPKWNDTIDLAWKTKAEYVKEKQELIESGQMAPQTRRFQRKFNAFREHKQSGGGDRKKQGGRGGRGGRGGPKSGQRGRGRGGRGRSNDRNEGKTAADSALTKGSNGIPEVKASEGGSKRKAEEPATGSSESKKPRPDSE